MSNNMNEMGATDSVLFSGVSRWKASLTHLGISLCLVGLVLGFVFLSWYPLPFFWISGVWLIILLMVVIDVCLGPVLTAVVFKPGKKGLKQDLLIIALFQIVALVYGAYTLHAGRIVYLVFNGEQFLQVRANEVVMDNPSETDPLYLKLPPSGIHLIALKPEARAENIKYGSANPRKLGGYFYTEFYTDYASAKEDIAKAARSKEWVFERWPSKKEEVSRLVDKYVDSILMPVYSEGGSVLAVLDGKTYELLDAVVLETRVN